MIAPTPKPSRKTRQLDTPEARRRNRDAVMAFYDLAFSKCRPAQAATIYMDEKFTHNVPGIPEGKNGFIEYLESAAREHPGKRVKFDHVIAEHPFVALHCHHSWPDCDDEEFILIFRLDETGKIAELWGVSQHVPLKRAAPKPKGGS
jgi:predicted SnoaL-like aldol condensation-catalyzing enzyme